MKKLIKKTAILMAFIMPVIGVASNTSTVSAAYGSSYSCNHITYRRTVGSGCFSTIFEDYCPLCGTVFGRGVMAGGPPLDEDPFNGAWWSV